MRPPWLLAGAAACVIACARGDEAFLRGTWSADQDLGAVRKGRKIARRKTASRDGPGGPREKSYFEDGDSPFETINSRGGDDQWHSWDPAAPEMNIPHEMMQVPNPSSMDMVARISAPEDRWPSAGQATPFDVKPAGKTGWQMTPPTLEGRPMDLMMDGHRVSLQWFTRNYRPVVAPEDSVPPAFYTYFEGFLKDNYKEDGEQKEASLLRFGGRVDAATAAAEAAVRAAAAATALGRAGGGARVMGPGPTGPALAGGSPDEDMSTLQAIEGDGDAALGDAKGALAEISHAEVTAAKAVEPPKKRHWKMKGQLLVPALVQGTKPAY